MFSRLIVTCLALASIAAVAQPAPRDDDPLLVRLSERVVVLPLQRALSVEGSGVLDFAMRGGRSVMELADGDSVLLNGELLWDDDEAIEGDRVSVLDERGEPVWTISVGALGAVQGTVDEVIPAVSELIAASAAHQRPRRRIIGVTTREASPALVAAVRSEDLPALVVAEVHDGYPAAEAGMQVHDVIVCIGDRDGATKDMLSEAIQACEPGEFVQLGVVRRGEGFRCRIPVVEIDGGPSEEAESAFLSALMERREHERRFDATRDELSRAESVLARVQQQLADQLDARRNIESEIAERLAALESRGGVNGNAEEVEMLARRLAETSEQVRRSSAAFDDARTLLTRRHAELAEVEARADLLREQALRGRELIDFTNAQAEGEAQRALLMLQAAEARHVEEEVGARLGRLEDRLARLEELLQQLNRAQDGAGSAR